MLRGIAVLIVAVLTLAASPPQKAGTKRHAQTEHDVAKSLREIATTLNRSQEPRDYERECQQGKDNRRSDLCAQWKAADAAGSAADAAWFFGSAGFVLGLLTLGAAGAAAVFAFMGARAARDTVNAFTTVERANIVVTLENFREEGGIYDAMTGSVIRKNITQSFDVLANNLGRSTAIIVHAGSGWDDSMAVKENMALLGPPKTYFVKPAASAKLDLHCNRSNAQMNEFPYLWVLVSFNSPLRGLRFVRYCFEVWGPNSSVPYIERSREEWGAEDKDKQGNRRWTPTGTIQSFKP